MLIGKTLGHYRIEAKLGEGGMGEVYRAVDTRLNRPAAIKVLPLAKTSDSERKKRFVQEARAASALNHPNIVTIYEIGTEDGVDFIAMEFVAGKSLTQVIGDKGLPLAGGLKCAIQIASALARAHKAGIIHRDIKPANIMITPDGLVKVMDFGLAKLNPAGQGGETGTTMTMGPRSEEGTIAGTPAYMSPEQAEGKPVDARSDIFSFGSTLYEIVTGRRAFKGDSRISTLAAVLHQEPEPVSRGVTGIPHELERVINRCLRKDPDRRFQDMDEVRIALEDLKEESDSGRGAAASPQDLSKSMTSGTYPDRPDLAAGATAAGSSRFLSSRGRRIAIIGAACLVILAVLVSYRTFLRDESTPAAVQRQLYRLTFDAGLQTEPTWSPDGRYIAYSSGRTGNYDIWVQQVSGGKPIQVTRNPSHDWQPAWSPGGNLIAFRSEREGGGIYVVEALGGYERKIASFGYRPRWSPDGSTLLVTSKFLAGISEPPELYQVSLDGTAPRRTLTEILSDFLGIPNIAWHPDGKRVSIMGYRHNTGFMFLTVPLSGTKELASDISPQVVKPLMELSLEVGGFVWGPSGRYLYLQGNSRSVTNLWRIAIDPSSLRWIAGPDRLTTGPGRDTEMALSPDGNRVAFSTQTTSSRIWSIPIDAAEGRVLGPGEPVSPEGLDAFQQDLSRDGRKLAFCAQRNARRELWVKSLDDGTETLVAADDAVRSFPRWSWDGTRLCCGRTNPARGESCTTVIEIGGGEERILTSAGRQVMETATDWSPDGQWILMSSSRSIEAPREIRLVPVAAAPNAESKERLVASNPEYNLWQPRFSPDGRWISFNAVRRTGVTVSTIHVVSASGGPWISISDGKSFADKARWSPDGRMIYYVSSQQGFLNVWAVGFDPAEGKLVREPIQLTTIGSPNRMILPQMTNLEICVSQRRLVIPIQDLSGNIWMLDNVDR